MRTVTEPTPGADPVLEAAAALADIAVPRLSGSPVFRYAATRVRERMARLGYDCEPLAFTCSAWVGRFGVPVAALLFTGATVAAAWSIVAGSLVPVAPALVIGPALAGAIAAAWPRLLHRFPLGRQTGENLLFTPRDSHPRFLVVAHLDTKSQLLPLAVRGPAIALAIAAWLVVVVSFVIVLAGGGAGAVPAVAGSVAGLAGLALGLSWAGNGSPGALDNASGVAAAIGAAAARRHTGDIAVLITDAEELGLAGSRAAAPLLPPVHGVINIDGIDDAGPFHVLERFGRPRRGIAPHLAVALLNAAATHDLPIRRRDVPFGLLLDHIPLVDAGFAALSLLRGHWRSLARVHRPADDLARLTGAGLADTVRLLDTAFDRLATGETASAAD